MQNIPLELIEDILRRMPVKSVKRFRCVSKHWRAVIDSQSFVKKHLRHSLITNSNRSLIIGGLGLYVVDLEELERARAVKPPFYYKSVYGITNSCNGLILVIGEELILWNVFTTEFRGLPPCPKESLVSDDYFSKTHYGFAYDEIADDYKVVRVVEFRLKVSHAWRRSELFIYGLKSNTWKNIEGFPYPIPFLKGNWRAHANGAMHTLVYATYNSDSIIGNERVDSDDTKIMAFDVHIEKHSRIGLPSGIVTMDVELSLDSIGGCLSLVCTKRNRVVIWVMKEYGVRESWVKLVSIGPPSIEKHDFVKPLVYSKDGGMVLLNCNDKRLVWFDLKKRVVVDDFNVEGMPFVFYAEPCVQSLVSLGGEFEVKPPKQEKKKLKNKRDDFLSVGFKLVL